MTDIFSATFDLTLQTGDVIQQPFSDVTRKGNVALPPFIGPSGCCKMGGIDG